MTDLAPCNWREDANDDWWPDCGGSIRGPWQFNDGGPAENNYSFCPHCGRNLVAVPYHEPEDSHD